ncbi:phosphate acyltransferase PlsX [Ferroacidibacillus organovorans]|uniref:Phosphate acyltransferase n=2 Tax=Ferroacidibacillus organovorans TaxID=1765683 RepID=A0A1V4ETH2_9BACL|nr:phosphate acyltransferase PlsX [Ferroacidibacillus organovorans]OPG16162.1 phosphate acyltransferase [Ferroacidibacillus organovorans]
MRLAIDVMGGDHAPMAPIEGAIRAALEHKQVEFILVGREEAIEQHRSNFPSNIRVRHAPDVIASDAEPVRSVRRQPDSSMVVAATLVRDNVVDGMVSAGNTGAFMVAGLLFVGRMQGIDRPALAGLLPSFQGNGVLLLDAGANTDCTDAHLLSFAKMGQAYAQVAMKIERPRIGLINIGAEPNKGNEVVKSAYRLLKREMEGFVGNVESREMLRDVCDVAVCDGFVGNTLVKFYEGAGAGLFDELRAMFMQTRLTRLTALFLRQGLKRFKMRFDYAEYGGGPFLGVNGILVKAHGSSSPRAFQVTINQAIKMHQNGLIHALQEAIANRPETGET